MLGGQQLELYFKGLRTSDYINPTEASALYCEIDDNSLKSKSYDNLKKIINRFVEECLKRQLVTKADLAKSHI